LSYIIETDGDNSARADVIFLSKRDMVLINITYRFLSINIRINKTIMAVSWDYSI